MPWVFRFDLTDSTFQEAVKEKSESGTLALLSHLAFLDNEFEKKLFRQRFDVQSQVVILLDGFDEIPTHFSD